MKIAITGSTGLVGSRIIEILNNDFQFLPFTHQSLDITDLTQVQNVLKNVEFDVFLHLAAYTNVDGAENERGQAHAINVLGTQNLFRTVREHNKKFIYFSTDFVFDGRNPPYNESSLPHPIGYYGQSKWEGEQVLENEATIIRISYPYGDSKAIKPDFVQRIRSLLEQGKELSMITDGAMTPTYIDDIVLSLKDIIVNNRSGLFHIVGSQSHTPYEVGTMIAEKYGFPGQIKPILYNEYTKGKAPRPQYSIIESNNNTFYLMKSFGEGLKKI